MELPETVNIPEMLSILEMVVSIPDEDIPEEVVNTKVIDTDKASEERMVR